MSTTVYEYINDTKVTATLTSRDSDVDRHIKSFLSNVRNEKKIIGLDTEWTLVESSDEEQQDTSETAILVLCGGESCLIYQLSDTIPRSLLNFLRLSDYTFVGMGIKSSLAKLEEECGLGCKNAVELGPLAAQVMENPRLSGYGVDELALKVVSLRLRRPTSVVFSDWGNNRLNKKQIKCVTLNAYAYFKIGSKLLAD